MDLSAVLLALLHHMMRIHVASSLRHGNTCSPFTRFIARYSYSIFFSARTRRTLQAAELRQYEYRTGFYGTLSGTDDG